MPAESRSTIVQVTSRKSPSRLRATEVRSFVVASDFASLHALLPAGAACSGTLDVGELVPGVSFDGWAFGHLT